MQENKIKSNIEKSNTYSWFKKQKLKTLSKPRREKNLHDLIQGKYQKPRANIIFKDERLSENFSLEVSKRQGCMLLPYLFNILVAVLGRGRRQEKFIQIGKK